MGMGRGRAWRWATGRSHAWVGGWVYLCRCGRAGREPHVGPRNRGGAGGMGIGSVRCPSGFKGERSAVKRYLCST